MPQYRMEVERCLGLTVSEASTYTCLLPASQAGAEHREVEEKQCAQQTKHLQAFLLRVAMSSTVCHPYTNMTNKSVPQPVVHHEGVIIGLSGLAPAMTWLLAPSHTSL